MLLFLQCMESSMHSSGGQFDPPFSTVEKDTQREAEESIPIVASADASKATRRFPWSKKEVNSKMYYESMLLVIFVKVFFCATVLKRKA